MSEATFEPSWERDREKFFSAIDFTKVTTPAYVIHLGALEENLKILAHVKEATGCRILLAQSVFDVESSASCHAVLGRGLCKLSE